MKTTDNQPKNASESARQESITSAERDAKREACLDDIVKSQARIVALLAANAERDAVHDAHLGRIDESLRQIGKSQARIVALLAANAERDAKRDEQLDSMNEGVS